MCCCALAKNNAKSMTEKNGGTAKPVCNSLSPVRWRAGYKLIPQKESIYFFTAFFFIGLGGNY